MGFSCAALRGICGGAAKGVKPFVSSDNVLDSTTNTELTSSRAVLERVMRVVTHLFGAPIVLIGNETSSFASGLDDGQKDIFQSFIDEIKGLEPGGEVSVILDAQKDERTAQLEAVQRLGLRFCACVTLNQQTFCVAHTEPRESFGDEARSVFLRRSILVRRAHVVASSG